MSELATVVFWLGVATVAWVYVGYPLFALVYGALRPVRARPSGARPALVTIGIAVHDAADLIAERIENVRGQEFGTEIEILVASDGSTDATPAIVRRMAETDSRIRLLELERVGQSAAQAEIFRAARGAVVVLTDAETRFGPGCLESLVAPFADARVGCTTGVLRWHHDRATTTAQHEGMYWRYEQRVRAWESRAGWLSAATGALLAARRELFEPVPSHASLDQMLPLICRRRGRLVLVVEGAAGSDRGTSGLAEQFWSRTRIATQGIEANLRMSLRIPPWRRPGTFVAIWSHKLLRWATPWLLLVAALGGLAAWLTGGSGLYLAPLAGALVLALIAAVGYFARRAGRSVPLVGFPLTVAAVNLAFGLAWLNVFLRRRVGSWDSAARVSR